MSIDHLTILLLVLTAMGVVIVLWLRAWTQRGLRGPSRLGPHEPLVALFLVMIVGFTVWATVPALLEKTGGKDPGSLRLVIGQTLGQVVAAMAILLAGKQIRGDSASRIGLHARPGKIFHGFSAALVGCCVALPATIWTSLVTEQILEKLRHGGHHAHELIQNLQNHPSPAMTFWVTVSAVVTAPLLEELFFRAYLQTALREFMRQPWLAILAASCLFAAMHPMWSWPAIFVLAVCLGYAYERTGNLWTCILMHAIFNAMELILFKTTPVNG